MGNPLTDGEEGTCLGLSLCPWLLILSKPGSEHFPLPSFFQAGRMGMQVRSFTSAVLLKGQESCWYVSLALFLHGRPASDAHIGLDLEE